LQLTLIEHGPVFPELQGHAHRQSPSLYSRPARSWFQAAARPSLAIAAIPGPGQHRRTGAQAFEQKEFQMIRVLVADDHAVVRHGLRQVLSLAPELVVVAEAKNAWETMERVREGGFDVLLLDMSMPGPSGLDLIRRVKTEAAHVPVLVLSMHADWQIAARAIKAGASGYLTKDSEPEVLIEAIRQVSKGANFIDPVLATRIIFNPEAGQSESPNGGLTDREYQVFRALVQGRSLVDIAEELHLSAKTVSTHKFRLMRKLGLSSMTELVRYAIRHGIVE
jgi:DNA-binding NarL/FixJ family response regulator